MKTVENVWEVFPGDTRACIPEVDVVGVLSPFEPDGDFASGMASEIVERIFEQIENDKNVERFTDMKNKGFLRLECDFVSLFI